MPSPGHSVHKSTLGHIGEFLPCDKHGYVPTKKTKPWDLKFDHNEPTHHEDGILTEYGQRWETAVAGDCSQGDGPDRSGPNGDG